MVALAKPCVITRAVHLLNPVYVCLQNPQVLDKNTAKLVAGEYDLLVVDKAEPTKPKVTCCTWQNPNTSVVILLNPVYVCLLKPTGAGQEHREAGGWRVRPAGGGQGRGRSHSRGGEADRVPEAGGP